MRRLITLSLVAAVLAVGALAYAGVNEFGQTEVSVGGSRAATNNAIQVDVTATAIPATPLRSRTSVTIQNLGPNDLWCGHTPATATSTTGLKVPAGSLSAVFPVSNGVLLYCTTSVLQTNPNDTRYEEL